MFCEHLLDYTGKSCVLDVFPNLSLYIHGGVNYALYRQKIQQLIGGPIDLIETYPAKVEGLQYIKRLDQKKIICNTKSIPLWISIEKDKIHDPKLNGIESGW